jgi:hypothetical protein
MSERVRRVRVTRSGGFVGASRTVEVDLSALPLEVARGLERLVAEAAEAGPGKAPAGPHATGPGADRFEYEVAVETDGGWRSERAGEAAMPPQLKALIDRVMELGRRPA